MLVNLALSVLPTVLTAAMIATEMPAAIKPYSMAVAPELSIRKRSTSLLIAKLRCCSKQPFADANITIGQTFMPA
jgi:hypothetical protein